MRVLKNVWYLALVAFFAATFSGIVLAQDTEWYAHKGYTVEEVMSGPGGQIVVMKDSQGTFSFVSPQFQTNPLYQVVAIGSEQVRLREANEKEPFMIPVMHNNLPLDLVAFVTLILQQKDVFIAAPIAEVVTRYSGTENYREELGDLLELKDSSLLVYSDVAMVGKGSAQAFPPLFSKSSSGSPIVTLSSFRTTLKAFLDTISKHTGKKYVTAADLNTPFSVHLSNLTCEAAIHYVSGLLGVEISAEEAPKPVMAEEPSTKNASEYISSKKAKKVLTKVKALAKAGRTKDAAKLMLKLVKRTEPNAVYYNMLSKLCWKAGAKRKAVLCLKKSLQIDPDNAYAKSTIQKIKAMRKVA